LTAALSTDIKGLVAQQVWIKGGPKIEAALCGQFALSRRALVRLGLADPTADADEVPPGT
jgi:hypothetical protein